MIFKIHFGPSSFYVFINTNPEEVFEFLKEYSSFSILVVTFLFFLPLFWLRLLVTSINKFRIKYIFDSYRLYKIIGLCVVLLLGLKFSGLIEHNLPYLLSRSFALNYKDSKYIDEFNSQIEKTSGVAEIKNVGINNTFIVVIGESATSSHMQLYGYYRETTPLFEEIRDDLSIYQDVISPNTSTFHSLSKALTLGNYEDPKKVLALPITTLFNKAGFKTFWISNHSPTFNPSSALARISNQAGIRYFNSKEVVMNNLKHDGELLYKVDEALKDQYPNKVIFLHLIGEHFSYENRYPKQFDFFQDIPKTPFRRRAVYQKINQYDNAVRYTDYIINSVFEKLKTENTNNYLMYFSDHGEEVFQDDDFYGHLEDRPTKNTFKVPFIMYYGKGFQFPDDYEFVGNRKYMTDDLWHSIVHISGIESTFLDKRRSIFSKHFAERKRIILENQDYETFFNDE
ncbi:phosphoethanolamine transferase [uncultured Algibacter sp.]|uniref:phosphoethanolamine transferase n=1 Tax=uncultured Algibacter sp. TaxID=298659 RepID=UPI002621BAD8|nr:phosphoethanolamine transferase [uncultured Algibacter sp.]